MSIAAIAGLAWADIIRALLLLLVGSVLARTVRAFVNRTVPASRLPLRIIRGAASWGIFILFMVAALHQLGFKLSVLLGAAGVLSVAIGFASQTSAANLISGLFLLAERSFEVGDTIQVGGTSGEVLSVDMLSVKLRTADNRYVRIPNEVLIKSETTNLSKFAIRRFDLMVGVAYHNDIRQVRNILLEVAAANPLCLEEPKPMLVVRGFGESAIDLQFSVWAARSNFLELGNTMQEQVKISFDAHGIEIPYPQRSLVVAAGSAPLNVRLQGGAEHG